MKMQSLKCLKSLKKSFNIHFRYCFYILLLLLLFYYYTIYNYIFKLLKF